MSKFVLVLIFFVSFILSCGKVDLGVNQAADLCNSVSGAESTILPSQLLDLTNWHITLPTGTPGTPDEITQPQLASFSVSPYFKVSSSGKCLLFNANAGGVVTPNATYPRSELREKTNSGADQASWATDTGKHTMISTVAITHLPVAKPDVVVNQIHGVSFDLLMVRLIRKRLYVEGNDPMANTDGVAINYGTLESNYELGTFFTVKIVVEGNRIDVYYNNMSTPKISINLPIVETGCYFKAGMYTHSNVSRGDLASAYGESAFTQLSVVHE